VAERLDDRVEIRLERIVVMNDWNDLMLGAE
jgi:hypothetical protein